MYQKKLENPDLEKQIAGFLVTCFNIQVEKQKQDGKQVVSET